MEDLSEVAVDVPVPRIQGVGPVVHSQSILVLLPLLGQLLGVRGLGDGGQHAWRPDPTPRCGRTRRLAEAARGPR